MDLVFSDNDSFSESSNSEDQDDVEFLYGGKASSILSSLADTLGKIDDFLSFERGFIHGDIVCFIKDPTGQMGKVVNVDILVDLEDMFGRKIEEVNTKDIKSIRSLSLGDYVVNNAWLGKVEKIVDRVAVLFPDGTKSDFMMSDSVSLIPTSPDLLEDPQYPFYPGQTVQVKGTSVSNSAGWFCGARRINRNQGTVCSVDAGLVYVSWIGCAHVGCEKVSAPPCLQDSRNLSLLSCFPHENWQLGDWCSLQGIVRKNTDGHYYLDATSYELVKGKEHEKDNFSHRLPDIAVIVKKKTKVDVLWQDGSYSMGLCSHSLISISIIDPHDFWPGQIVLEKEMCDDSPSPSIHKWGTIKSVDAKERTVKVRWSTVAFDQPANVKLEQTEETVSAYELIEHPDYAYSFGDAVFKLHKSLLTDHSDEKTCRDPLVSKQHTAIGNDPSYTNNCREHTDFLYNNLISSIGVIVSLGDGDVEVKWASGVTERVAPYEVRRVEKCEIVNSTIDVTATAEQTFQGKPELDNQLTEQEGKDKESCSPSNEDVQKKLSGSSSCSLPQAAIGLFAHVGSSLFGYLSTSLLGAYKLISDDGEIQNEEVLEINQTSGDTALTVHLGAIMDTTVEPIFDEAEEGKHHHPQQGRMNHEHFRQFDMVNGFSDHYFAEGFDLGTSQLKRNWLKKVHEEWNILERDLPETIWVRAYEERMELLRAAIVGPQGTPYHDGLFFFDIALPPDYPNAPPMVYYHSGGLRLNPNLYESGKVCLSLLNTWTGSGSEVWNPKGSTILQVLLSLQALVLNEKPYFNEAGYDLQIEKAEAEKNSVSYNENAFLVSCKSMIYLLRRPPKHFEALIEEHFNQRGKHILLACKAYMKGCPVGSAFGDTTMNQERTKGSSMGFKIMLRKIFPRLLEAFSIKGINCSHLSDQDE